MWPSPENGKHYCQNETDYKENPGDIGGCTCDAGKTHDTGDNGYDEKYYC